MIDASEYSLCHDGPHGNQLSRSFVLQKAGHELLIRLQLGQAFCLSFLLDHWLGDSKSAVALVMRGANPTLAASASSSTFFNASTEMIDLALDPS